MEERDIIMRCGGEKKVPLIRSDSRERQLSFLSFSAGVVVCRD